MDIQTSSGSNHSLSENISPGSIVPIIQNIVSTVNLGCKLDLASIALRARNTEYRPKRFTAVVMRIRNPKTTTLIFASGKLVCTGAKTEQDSKIAMRKYARIIQKLGFSVKMSDFKIQNIVGSCDVRFSIRLETFVFDSHVDGYSCYEPEVFPGLIHKMNNPRVSILIFASGKVVITGAKEKEDVFTAFRNIYPVVKQHKRLPNT